MRSRQRYATRNQDEAVLSEQLYQLKQTRSGHKAVLTRKRNELLEIMKRDSNIDEKKLKSGELDEIFKTFATAHSNVQYQLNDEIEIQESDYYYKQELEQVQHLNRRIKLWIERVEKKESATSDINPEDSVRVEYVLGQGLAQRKALEVKLKSLRNKA